MSVINNILLNFREFATDLELLKSLGVTHILNAACGKRYNQVSYQTFCFNTLPAYNYHIV